MTRKHAGWLASLLFTTGLAIVRPACGVVEPLDLLSEPVQVCGRAFELCSSGWTYKGRLGFSTEISLPPTVRIKCRLLLMRVLRESAVVQHNVK